MDKYIISDYKNKTFGFYLNDNVLTDIKCYESDSLIGNIYVGRISNIVNNINACFVDIMPNESCYLSMEDYKGSRKLKKGDLLTVMVTKDKIKTKQASVTTNISLTGEYVVINIDESVGVSSKIADNSLRDELKACFTACRDEYDAKKRCEDVQFGCIMRTKAATLIKENPEIIKTEIMTLIKKLDDILYDSCFRTAYSIMYENSDELTEDAAKYNLNDVEIVTDNKICYDKIIENGYKATFYDDKISLMDLHSLNNIMSKLLLPKAFLKSGGYLVIEVTEALTVIDVNTGKAIKGNDAEKNKLKINLEAAQEAVRQIRLRNLSGIIIIDFINMKNSSDTKQLIDYINELFSQDYVLAKAVDITKLGLMEITRKKVKKPLHEIF